jgi:hypothetical protein
LIILKAGRIAQLVKLGRHRVERGPRLGEGRRAAGREDGEFALRGALRAAADRCVEIETAARFQPLGKHARHIGIHRGGRDKHRAVRHGGSCAVLAEQDRFGLRGIDHDRHDDGGICGGLRRCGRAASACLNETLHRVGTDVAADNLEASPQQRRRHAEAHRPQTDDGDARARRRRRWRGLRGRLLCHRWPFVR